jgi:hypothetical protein
MGGEEEGEREWKGKEGEGNRIEGKGREWKGRGGRKRGGEGMDAPGAGPPKIFGLEPPLLKAKEWSLVLMVKFKD